MKFPLKPFAQLCEAFDHSLFTDCTPGNKSTNHDKE